MEQQNYINIHIEWASMPSILSNYKHLCQFKSVCVPRKGDWLDFSIYDCTEAIESDKTLSDEDKSYYINKIEEASSSMMVGHVEWFFAENKVHIYAVTDSDYEKYHK